MPNAYISGTGFYVPPRVVTNDQLVEEYGIDTSNEWIVKRTGIEQRRFAEEGIGTADLAVDASLMAIEDAGLEKGDIDMIVFATLSPEHAFPGLKPGDRWCLCIDRWREALDAGVAPPVVLEATHISVLEYVDLDVLRVHALDGDPAGPGRPAHPFDHHHRGR